MFSKHHVRKYESEARGGIAMFRRSLMVSAVLAALAAASGNALAQLLFFTATNLPHGRELWVSDGTRAGTHIVRDLNPGDASTAIDQIVPVRGGVVFVGYPSGGGDVNVYFSDGTRANTRILKSQATGIYGGAGGHFYFGTYAEPGLWYTDGTAAGTRRVPGGEGLQFHAGVFRPYGSTKTLIVAPPFPWDGVRSVAYLHDRVANKLTKLPVSIANRSVPWPVAVIGSKFIYVNDTPRYGAELWVSDGTKAGTKLLKDILRGSLGALDGAFNPTGQLGGPFAFRGKVYFAANDNIHGSELWVTDGTRRAPGCLRISPPAPRARTSC
jgi:ELWxxDGT repeat protein